MLPRRRFLTAGLLAATAGLVRPVRACEIDAGNLRITHPWTRATAAGDDHAVVCMKIDEVTAPDRLIGVESPVASAAVMGGPRAGAPVNVPVPVGVESWLSEEGDHVRLIGLRQPLELGRVYPLTLTFERSGIVIAKLTVDFERRG